MISLKFAEDTIGKDRFLTEINATYLSLIPKSLEALSVFEFQPISLCNVLYKIMSKILSSHLQEIVGILASLEQGVFLVARQIFDDIVLCHEALDILHHRHSPSGRMTLKIDMMKAYDRVK